MVHCSRASGYCITLLSTLHYLYLHYRFILCFYGIYGESSFCSNYLPSASLVTILFSMNLLADPKYFLNIIIKKKSIHRMKIVTSLLILWDVSAMS